MNTTMHTTTAAAPGQAGDITSRARDAQNALAAKEKERGGAVSLKIILSADYPRDDVRAIISQRGGHCEYRPMSEPRDGGIEMAREFGINYGDECHQSVLLHFPPRYTIRPLGKCYWAKAETIEDAKREAAIARQRLASERIVIYDEQEGRVVGDE